MVKPYQPLAYFATISILISAIIAAFNIYPLYIYAFLFSNLIWAFIGLLWKEKSLILMNIGLSIIYIAGLVLPFSN